MALIQGEKTCTAALRKPEPTQADSLVVGALAGQAYPHHAGSPDPSPFQDDHR